MVEHLKLARPKIALKMGKKSKRQLAAEARAAERRRQRDHLAAPGAEAFKAPEPRLALGIDLAPVKGSTLVLLAQDFLRCDSAPQFRGSGGYSGSDQASHHRWPPEDGLP